MSQGILQGYIHLRAGILLQIVQLTLAAKPQSLIVSFKAQLFRNLFQRQTEWAVRRQIVHLDHLLKIKRTKQSSLSIQTTARCYLRMEFLRIRSLSTARKCSIWSSTKFSTTNQICRSKLNCKSSNSSFRNKKMSKLSLLTLKGCTQRSQFQLQKSRKSLYKKEHLWELNHLRERNFALIN